MPHCSSVSSRISAAFLLLIFSGFASALEAYTSLNYDEENRQLSGISVTSIYYGEYESGMYCSQMVTIPHPLNELDTVQVCIRVTVYLVYAGTYGQLDGPSGTYYSFYHTNGSLASAVGYPYISDPEAGQWTASADHYVVEELHDCEAFWIIGAVPPWGTPNIGPCSWYWTENYYITSSSAVANVPACIHHGSPTNGSMSGDVSLPDSGYGYYHHLGTDAPDTDDWACENHAIQKLIAAGVWWYMSFGLGPRIGIGDISRMHGGSFLPDHNSHQNGLDVDIRYVRNDGYEDVLNFNQYPPGTPAPYDNQKTHALIQWFCDMGATVVYVDARASVTASCAVVWPNHHHHFHVRFPDPDGTSN